MLDLKLAHSFDRFRLDINLSAPAGVTALFGASGAGKTTIIQSVAGLLSPDAGRIVLDGEVLFDRETGVSRPPQQRQLGYVFQEPRLFPHMTVMRNLTYGPRARGLARDPGHFDEIVDLLGLDYVLERHPAALSGGEKQRVALGRALLSKPKILLLDEPLSALDSARKDEILPFLEKLRDQAKIPMLYVSHSVSEVARLANHVAILENGLIRRFGPVESVFADVKAARSFGLREAGSLLSAVVVAQHEDGLTELESAGTRWFLPSLQNPLGGVLRLRIKASDVMLSRHQPEAISALNIAKGVITDIQQGSGPGVLVRLECGGVGLLSRITRRSAQALELGVGQEIFGIVKSVSVAQSDIGS
jgi:molybdate transport system ATP-binding protein